MGLGELLRLVLGVGGRSRAVVGFLLGLGLGLILGLDFGLNVQLGLVLL